MRHIILFILIVGLAFTGISQPSYKVGDKLEVYDPIEKNWFKSTIIKAENGQYFIHYEGYDSKWDTWVAPARMRNIGEKKGAPVFFNAGSSEKLYNFYVADDILVTAFSPDTVAFVSGRDKDVYKFKMSPTLGYLMGSKIYENNLYVHRVDDNSFLLARSNSAVTYYHRDKDEGTRIINNNSIQKDIDSLLARVERAERYALKAKQSADKDRQLAALSKFVSTYSSRLNDAALEKSITTWWNGPGVVVNPLVKIFVASPDWAIVRNDLGLVMSKQVCVILVFKKGANNKCYMQWRNMGYEHLGGGAFDKQLKAWSPSDIIFTAEGQPLDAGTDYEVKCEAVRK